MQHGKYKTFDQLAHDVHTMCENARTYNEEGSTVYLDATAMEREFDANLQQMRDVLRGMGAPAVCGLP